MSPSYKKQPRLYKHRTAAARHYPCPGRASLGAAAPPCPAHAGSHCSQATTRSQALRTCYTGSNWGLYKIVYSTFAILLFPSLDLQLVGPNPKWTQTINQQGVTRWIHIDHKGLIPDCCQSPHSSSIPSLLPYPTSFSILQSFSLPTIVLSPHHRSQSPNQFPSQYRQVALIVSIFGHCATTLKLRLCYYPRLPKTLPSQQPSCLQGFRWGITHGC